MTVDSAPKTPKKLPYYLMVDRNGEKLIPGDFVRHIASGEVAIVLSPEEFDATLFDIKHYSPPTTVKVSLGFDKIMRVEPNVIEKTSKMTLRQAFLQKLLSQKDDFADYVKATLIILISLFFGLFVYPSTGSFLATTGAVGSVLFYLLYQP